MRVLNQKYCKKIPKNISLFEQYYKEFLHMRNEFVDDLCNTHTLTLTELEKTCQHSVNIVQKLDMLCDKFRLSKVIQTDLDPTTILHTYKELFERCKLNTFYSGGFLFQIVSVYSQIAKTTHL